MPEITCIIVSHNKPDYIKEAVASVLGQTFEDWQAILVDSGELYYKGFYDWITDPRFIVMASGETAELRKNKAMAPWCFNQCFKKKLVEGNIVTYLCDDDIWYDNAFATFAKYFSDRPDIDAVYASQDIGIHNENGRFVIGERRATTVMGVAGNGPTMDCRIDYLQFCHTKRILDRLTEYWPESLTTANHADGVFMDRIGRLVPVYPIDVKVGQNRRTPLSTYIPTR